MMYKPHINFKLKKESGLVTLKIVGSFLKTFILDTQTNVCRHVWDNFSYTSIATVQCICFYKLKHKSKLFISYGSWQHAKDVDRTFQNISCILYSILCHIEDHKNVVLNQYRTTFLLLHLIFWLTNLN